MLRDTIFLIIILIFVYIIKGNQPYNPYAELKQYTVGDGKNLKIAVISDSQLPTKPDEAEWGIFKEYISHLHKALQIIKEENVDVIVFAGDAVHAGTEYSFNLFKSIYEQYFPLKSENAPILNIILGNHDYYPKNPDYPDYNSNTNSDDDPVIFQKRFEKYFGEKAFSHKVINGIHFINWSSESSSYEKSNTNTEWAKKQIEIALKDDPTGNSKPIFVTTHLGPYNTCYGSDLWGNKDVLNALKNYQNVISLSGHSHYAITDEKSIWQGDFTALQTESTSYMELEPGTENGSVPRDEYNDYKASRRNPMGYFVYVDSNEVRFRRFSIATNEYYLPDWVIPLPINKEDFIYDFESRKAKSAPIEWRGEQKIDVTKEKSVDDEEIYIIKFNQPDCESITNKYKINFKNKEGEVKTYYYFSDFYLMPRMRKKYIRLKVPTEIGNNKGEYELEVWAIDTWGRDSINSFKYTIYLN